MKRNRKVSINDNLIVECRESESIYQVLTDSGFTFLGHCGGKGICGKCRVKIRQTDGREETVSACQYGITEDIAVYTGDAWQSVRDTAIKDSSRQAEKMPETDSFADCFTYAAKSIGAAVDLGSTTIAVSCMDLENRKEICCFSFMNPQYTYGADVISRIRFCMESKENPLLLKRLIEKMLEEKLKENLGTAYSAITRIVFGGNTTMFHLLRGFSVEGLAQAPFTPVSTDYDTVEKNAVKQIFPPGFSAFAGADILIGAEALGMGNTGDYDLLVDLGTNGEMLLLNQDCGYVSAAACGTVFDSALGGAVYGSETIKAVANCVKRRLIDSSGKIARAYFEKGIELDKGFVIRQENIRDFQLAKGAVYAGIQCLLKEAGITADGVANVYISGGLGFYLDIRDAFTVKLLPEEFRGKINISGNTSLEGAKKLVLADSAERKVIVSGYQAIKERTKSLELANLENFQDIYLGSLDF